MSAAQTPPPSPLSNLPSRETLEARVVEPGPRPRVHGYDVQGDLARHYSLAEVTLTTLVGEAPTPVSGARFSVASCFAAPVSIADSPTHATTIARTLGTSPSNLLAIAAVALTEQAHDVVERHADLLAWLGQTHEGEAGAPPPVDAAAIGDDEREAVERLRAALREQDAYTPRLDGEHTLESAILTTFHGAGLRRRWHFESALCNARWPAAIAEAMAAGVGQIIGYPVDLPAIVYDPSARAEPGPGVPPIPIIPKGDDDV